MFQLAETLPQIWWPVTVKWPSATEPGATEDKTFKVLFAAIDREEGEALDEEVRKAELAGDTSKRDLLMLHVVKNWAEVYSPGDSKTLLTFSEDALKRALRISWVRIGFNRAWTGFVNADHRLGN